MDFNAIGPREFIYHKGRVYFRDEVRNFLLRQMEEIKKEKKGKKLVANEEGIRNFQEVLAILKEYFKDDEDVEFEVRINDPAMGWGAITVTGIVLNLDSATLVKIADKIRHLETVSNEDGSASMIIDFNDLMKWE